jgi:hypothetical protein
MIVSTTRVDRLMSEHLSFLKSVCLLSHSFQLLDVQRVLGSPSLGTPYSCLWTSIWVQNEQHKIFQSKGSWKKMVQHVVNTNSFHVQLMCIRWLNLLKFIHKQYPSYCQWMWDSFHTIPFKKSFGFDSRKVFSFDKPHLWFLKNGQIINILVCDEWLITHYQTLKRDISE